MTSECNSDILFLNKVIGQQQRDYVVLLFV